MEKFTDIKLQSYSIKKEYYPEKGYVKCSDCPKLLHCGFCVQHLRNQNPHHWVGITVNEVPGCRGCNERYQRGITEAKNEATWLKKKLSILEMRLTLHAEDLKEAHDFADMQLTAQQLAYEGVESVMEMDLRAQIEDLSKNNEDAESIAVMEMDLRSQDLSKNNEDAESIVGMKLRLELEKMQEAYESAESKVTFLKRRPPESAAAGGLGSTLPILGDVTFVVQGLKVYAHQLILGYKSTVFQKIFEKELHQELPPELPQTIPETFKKVKAPIPPIPPPPPPPPPPPLPPPPEEKVAEKPEEKPRKKRDRIVPAVKVRLASSSMLEQMGLRGVRCQLSVATGQLLVDDAASQTPVPQLRQGYSPETRHRENGETMDIKTIDSGQRPQSGRTNSDTTSTFSPLLVFPAVNNVQAQTAPLEAPDQHAPADLKMVVTPPTVHTQGPEEPKEDRNDDKPKEDTDTKVASQINEQEAPLGKQEEDTSTIVALRINEQEAPLGRTNLFHTLQSERQAHENLIQIHDISYEVLQSVINCFYTAEMDFTEVSPTEVLKVAHNYEIDYIRDLCERELCERLDAGNVAEMLKLGRKFGAKRLHLKATQFFKDNFDEVQESVLHSCC